MKRPILPKEHGAWAVLYGAFLAGVGVAGRATLPVGLLLFGVTLLALASEASTQFLRPACGEQRVGADRHVAKWLLAYGIGAAACLGPLFLTYRMAFLLPFGIGAIGFMGVRAFLVRRGDDRSLAGELVGTAGLTLVGPTAHAVAVGGPRPTGAVLWLLLFLFFAGGVFYVRMRVRLTLAERRGAAGAAVPARRWCVAYHLLLLLLVPLLAATRMIPWAVLLAYAPALWRAAAGLQRRDARLNLRRLGWSEVGLTATFIALLVLTL